MDKRIQLAQTQLVTTGTDVAGSIFNMANLAENPTRVKVEHIFVTNSTTTDQFFSLYHDKDGVTFDETTLLWTTTTAYAQGTIQIDANIGVDSKEENIGAKSMVALGLTYTIYGVMEGV